MFLISQQKYLEYLEVAESHLRFMYYEMSSSPTPGSRAAASIVQVSSPRSFLVSSD